MRDWAISGIVTYQSGLPFSVTDSSTGGIYGATLGTAQFLCSSIQSAYTTGSTSDKVAHYLNPACFGTAPIIPATGFTSNPGATGWGTTPRNAFRGPMQQNWDFSLIRRFTVREKEHFQVRMDVFNLFNHPVFRIPSGSTSVNINGGTSSFTRLLETAVPARLIQFGVSYTH
jgi:hypothetical protein